MKKWKWYDYLFFLMALAAVSRFLMWEHGPKLINKTAEAYGNLFQNTIHG